MTAPLPRPYRWLLVLPLVAALACSGPAASAPPAATARESAAAAARPPTTATASGAAAAAASASAAAVTAPSPLNPPVKVRLGVLGIAPEAGLFIALDKGYFQAEGLDVEEVPLQAGGGD